MSCSANPDCSRISRSFTTHRLTRCPWTLLTWFKYIRYVFYITHWIIKVYQDFLFQTAQLLIFIDLDKLNCLTDLEFLRLNLPSFNRCYTLNQPSSNRAVKSDFCRELLIVRPSLNILVIKWLETLPSQEGVNTCAVGEPAGRLLRDVVGWPLTTESSLFPCRDTFVMTMAGRVLAVKNHTRIFRGYFNRKKVRRKHLMCKLFKQNCC